MDNKFLNGYLGSMPSNERGKLSQAEKGVEAAKKNAFLVGLGAGVLTFGCALVQHWKSKENYSENKNGSKWSNNKPYRK